MAGERLSKNEKLTLYAMVKNPTFTDREISDDIGLNLSTVTAIRKRLRKRGFYFQVRVPCLHKFGAEMMMVQYANLNPAFSHEERLRIGKKLLDNIEEIVYVVSEEHQSFLISIGENYTTLRRDVEMLEYEYNKHGFLKDGFVSYVMFPFEISAVLNFFDFTGILRREFGIEDEVKREPFCNRKVGALDMNRLERKVLYGLVSYPELPDIKVARKIAVSRHTVSNVRKEFEEERVLKTLTIPDLRKLGFRIISFSHSNFKSNAPLSAREDGIKYIRDKELEFFMVSSDAENILVTVYKEFEEYQKSMKEAISFYEKREWFEKEPFVALYSIPDLITVKNLVFAPLVRKILRITDAELRI